MQRGEGRAGTFLKCVLNIKAEQVSTRHSGEQRDLQVDRQRNESKSLYEVAGGQRSGPCAPATPCLQLRGVNRCSQTDFHHRRRRLNQTTAAGQFPCSSPSSPITHRTLARSIHFHPHAVFHLSLPPPLPTCGPCQLVSHSIVLSALHKAATLT